MQRPRPTHISARAILRLTLALLTGIAHAATPLYQGYIGETEGGPLYIHDWSNPSVSSGVQTLVAPPGSISTRRSAGGIAISPDSSAVYVGDSDADQIMVFRTATGTFDAATISAGGRVRGLAVGPTGRFLYAARGNTAATNALQVIDLTGVLPPLVIPLSARPMLVAVTPDNSNVVVTLNTSAAAVVGISGATHTFRGNVALPGAPFDVVITPDSKRGILPISTAGLVSSVTLSTLARADWPVAGCSPGNAALSPAGTRLYLACFAASTFQVRNASTGALIASGSFPPSTPTQAFFGPFTVSVTPDGRAAWFRGDPYGSFWVLDTATLSFTHFVGSSEHEFNKIVFGKPFYEGIDPVSGLLSSTGVRESAPAPCAPGQVFRVAAQWKNNSAKAWTNVFAEVKTLTGGNTLINQSWDLTPDGVVNPGESFTGTFRINLASCSPFSFQVALAATTEAALAGGMFSKSTPVEKLTRPAGSLEDTGMAFDLTEDGAVFEFTPDPR